MTDKKKILIGEGVLSSRYFYEKDLSKDYDIEIVGSVDEVVARIREVGKSLDLLIMDSGLNSSGTNSLSIATQCRGAYPNLPIVLSTASQERYGEMPKHNIVVFGKYPDQRLSDYIKRTLG